MAINVSDNNPRINYTATSGQTVFTVPFEFFASTDLTVYVGGSVLSASFYTVTGGNGSTGSITTNSGQTAGAEIAIVRDVPLERTTDLTSTYSASSLNDQLDRLVTQVADLDDRVSRSISLNDYEVGVSLDLPAKASRLGKTVQFNSITGALEVGPSGNELTSIASIASEITALDGIKTNITTVAGAISNVNSVGSNISSVTSVASSISNVNTVNTNIANVNLVGGSIADLNDVADSLDQVELVGGSISNVDIVGAAISNVNTAAGNISNINTVASISSNITTVAGITSAISTVNGNATNINLAATNIDDINDVANVITKVTTVADNIANVNAVAPSVGYLSTVANNISNINTLAPISADITTVAGVASSVSSAAANAAAAESAKVAAEAAQAAAELAADTFEDTYLGAKASDPLTDNDGDALNAGDLYFNTGSNVLKVYDGSSWAAAALDASGYITIAGGTLTDNLSFGDNDKAIFGAGSDLQIYHNGSHSIIADVGTGNLNIYGENLNLQNSDGSKNYIRCTVNGAVDIRYNNSTKLATTSTGVDVTGTLTSDGLTVEASDPFITLTDGDTGVDHEIDAQSGIGNLTLNVDKNSEGSNSGFVVNVKGNQYMRVDDSGDISFYEDTGTTAKFFWDASAERLGLGTTSPSSNIDIEDAAEVRIDLNSTAGRIYRLRSTTDSKFIIRDSSAAADRLSIDSSGNVGIGTSSPASIIHSLHPTSPKLTLERDSTSLANNNVIGEIAMAHKDSNDAGTAVRIIGRAEGTGGAAGLAFNTGLPSSTAEAMRIDSSGNIGIGTSSPTGKLSVSDPTYLSNTATLGSSITLNSENTASWLGTRELISLESVGNGADHRTGTLSIKLKKGVSDTTLTEYMQINAVLNYTTFSTDGSEAMRIDSSGNVGIGTSSPSSALHVSGSGAEEIRITRTGGAGRTYSTSVGGSLEYNIRDENAGVNRLSISTAGNVGIGTSSPNNPLTVVTDSSANGINIVGRSSDDRAYMYFSENDGTTFTGSIHTIPSSNRFNLNAYSGKNITFSVNGAEKVRIDSSGNLLVGKTSIGTSTDGFEARAGGTTGVSDTSGPALYVNRNGSDGDMVLFQKVGATVGSIFSSGGIQMGIGDGDTALLFGDNIDAILPWSASSNAQRDDAIDLGRSATRFKDIYATNGTIQTSDRNEKQDIAELSDAEQRVAVAAKGLLRKFRWRDAVEAKGDDARTHFGIIAQDLQAAFAAEGLDAGDYAMFISSTWTDEETGEERTRMGVRYSELLAFIIAAI